MSRFPVALLLLALPVAASAKEYTLTRVLNQVTAGQTFTVGADWIEPTPQDFSVGLVLTNEVTDRALVLRKEEISCARGQTTGEVKGTGSISFAPGETESVNVICVVPSSATGPYTISIGKVYDDPEQLGQPTEAVLFERIAWQVAETGIAKKAQKVPADFVPAVTDDPVPPPAGPLGVPPATKSLMASLHDKVVDSLASDGVKPPFEVGTKEYTLTRARNQVTVGDTLILGADAIHPQNDHFVVRLALTNTSKTPVVIPRREMACLRGETPATLDHAAMGVGKDLIPLAPSETKILTLSCAIGADVTGPFTVKIGRVLSDPTGSGAATGAVSVEGARWSIAEADLDPEVQSTPR